MSKSASATEFAALSAAFSAINPYMTAAIGAYEFYQTQFGPPPPVIDWEGIIDKAVNTIIQAVKDENFKEAKSKLEVASQQWAQITTHLRNNPVSPASVQSALTFAPVEAVIRDTLIGINYFNTVADQEYETFQILSSAYSILFSLYIIKESYFIAVNGKKSGFKLSEEIAMDMAFLVKWPERYFKARAKHITVEIEEKYSGPTQGIGGARRKRPTGWYILHDARPDPITSNLNGMRFHKKFPVPVDEVRIQYKQSILATEVIPNLLSEWHKIYKAAAESESKPLPTS